MKLADRMSRLGTETAFEVLVRAKALAAKGHDVVHLEIGEPDFDTPNNIKEAAVKALRDNWTHYGPSAGQPLLRETIAEYISKTRNIKVDASNVVVVPGGKPIIFFPILALAGDGDEVIYPNPGFPIYESMINFSGAKAVPIPLREDRDFAFDVNELIGKINDRTRLIILNSPQNPTGGMLPREDLKAIAEAVRDRNLMILSDEIYSRIVFEGKAESITQFPGMLEKTIILDGFSKTYAMTGWRMGYGVMPAELATQIAKLQTNATSCTASFTQIAGVEALRGDQSGAEKMVAEFRRRRDFIVKRLNQIEGLSCRMPKGAFYVFPNIKKTGMKSKEFEEKLLNEAFVASLAGTSFGAYGEGYVRFSYANSMENLAKAMDRVEQFVAKKVLV
ncbi:MAG: pyridoxal phosphate-dependent aminotransferase [Acidobacteriia bacterium]|nr:pyridoxal phosphate-dependent aminotransferase [Terriglobia bacterium]